MLPIPNQHDLNRLFVMATPELRAASASLATLSNALFFVARSRECREAGQFDDALHYMQQMDRSLSLLPLPEGITTAADFDPFSEEAREWVSDGRL